MEAEALVSKKSVDQLCRASVGLQSLMKLRVVNLSKQVRLRCAGSAADTSPEILGGHWIDYVAVAVVVAAAEIVFDLEAARLIAAVEIEIDLSIILMVAEIAGKEV